MCDLPQISHHEEVVETGGLIHPKTVTGGKGIANSFITEFLVGTDSSEPIALVIAIQMELDFFLMDS
jgi:hypothetical protein